MIPWVIFRRSLMIALAAFHLALATAFAGNQALVTGFYAGSLGAGGATAAERSGFGQNPAALRPDRIGAHADFHQPFGMDGLQVSEAGISGDAGFFGAAFDWRETGVEGLYGEQGLQASQTLRLGRAGSAFPGILDLGASWIRWQSFWPGGGREIAWSHGCGAVWWPIRRFKAGAFAAGLPLEAGARERTDRVLQWGFEADSRDPDGDDFLQVLRLDFRKTADTPWRILASLSLRPHPSVEFTAGMANPPFQGSLGVRLAWHGAEWRQALRYHRYLGRTWLSGLVYSHPWRTSGAR
ncbi:MAG: hypothetical protein ABIW76_07165 [Fibrobacteria bacterium]